MCKHFKQYKAEWPSLYHDLIPLTMMWLLHKFYLGETAPFFRIKIRFFPIRDIELVLFLTLKFQLLKPLQLKNLINISIKPSLSIVSSVERRHAIWRSPTMTRKLVKLCQIAFLHLHTFVSDDGFFQFWTSWSEIYRFILSVLQLW